ncbi:NAD(P)-dependent oxidoreductase [Cellulomonas soli]|uniref:NAD(P)-dependent oxidoreductase n=1 Tax=Cellulomonas soli TaxID=931535 RepID=UPI003F85781B
MARIKVLGGTGYTGGNIVREAARRGHQVTSYSRNAPAEPVEGVTYVTGDATDSALLQQVVTDADVVIEALAPRGPLAGAVRGVVAELTAAVQGTGTRLGVIGGAGSLHVAPGGPRVYDTEGFPAEYRPESLEMGAVLDDLRASDEQVDWFYLSPAGGYGAFAPGEHTGTFRLGDDVLLVDADGGSNISGADLAQAIVDEIEAPAHRRARFTVAY